MTPSQYREAIAALSLTQGEAATFLGVSLRTSAAYCSGEFPVPLATAKLLKLLLKLGIRPEAI